MSRHVTQIDIVIVVLHTWCNDLVLSQKMSLKTGWVCLGGCFADSWCVP